jgi:hypothetical protein
MTSTKAIITIVIIWIVTITAGLFEMTQAHDYNVHCIHHAEVEYKMTQLQMKADQSTGLKRVVLLKKIDKLFPTWAKTGELCFR